MTIKELSLGSSLFRLFMQDQVPLIECEGHLFNHIWLLTQRYPCLSDSAYLKEFSEMSNFLWKGLKFQFIDQIEVYQQFYLEQIAQEKKHCSDVFQYRLTDYKIFDISVMHPPYLEEGSLFYFVYDTSTGLPYRVVCSFPYYSNSTRVHYQILPFKKD